MAVIGKEVAAGRTAVGEASIAVANVTTSTVHDRLHTNGTDEFR